MENYGTLLENDGTLLENDGTTDEKETTVYHGPFNVDMSIFGA